MRKITGFIAGLLLGLTTLAIVVFMFTALPQTQPTGVAAQATATTTTPPPATKTDEADYLSAFGQSLASHLGISQDKLNEAVAGAASDTIDQMLKDGKITQDDAAKMKDATKGGMSGLLLVLKMGANNGGPKSGVNVEFMPAVYDALVKTFNLGSVDELKQKLAGGQSLAEFAEAQHIGAAKVKEVILNTIKAQLDEAVKAGKIKQADEDEFMKTAPNLADKLLNGKPGAEIIPGPGAKDALMNPKGLLLGSLDDVAASLKLSRADLDSKWRTTSLAEIAKAQNVDVTALKTTMQNSFKAQADALVKDGKIDQKAGDDLLKAANNMLDDFINSVPNSDGSRSKP